MEFWIGLLTRSGKRFYRNQRTLPRHNGGLPNLSLAFLPGVVLRLS